MASLALPHFLPCSPQLSRKVHGFGKISDEEHAFSFYLQTYLELLLIPGRIQRANKRTYIFTYIA
jgi:hypothetical protein